MVTLRIVFFGTPEFAVPALRSLIASPHFVVAVVTQPDRPRGRGQHVSFSPVKTLALAEGVPVLQPERLKTPDFLQAVSDLEADLGVVAAYGKILPESVLQVPRLGMINIHASLLPAYRGAAPVHRAVIAGERETGVSIMKVVRELDAGPVFAAVRRPIPEDETSADVERALAQIGASLCARVVDDLAAGRASEIPQDASRATYAQRLTKEEGALDWARPARELHNQIRGLHPWPHAHTFLGRERILVLRSAVQEDLGSGQAAPGTIVRAAGTDLVVSTGRGTLRLIELRPEGKRAMSPGEFMAGRHLKPGMRFTPSPTALP
jgi:methionyl-tRNA formyltransferase